VLKLVNQVVTSRQSDANAGQSSQRRQRKTVRQSSACWSIARGDVEKGSIANLQEDETIRASIQCCGGQSLRVCLTDNRKQQKQGLQEDDSIKKEQ